MKKFWVLVFSLFLAFLYPHRTLAEGEFVVDSTVEYKVEVSGQTQVTHTVTLENAFSNLYATAYSLVLENTEPAGIRAYDAGGELPTKIEKEDNKTKIRIGFNDPLVGKDKQRTFYLTYLVADLAQKTGEVWEISIPRLADEKSFRNYTVTLLIPEAFKEPAYLSPPATKQGLRDGYRAYTFTKETVSSIGITAGFGDFQVFSFALNYHLENPLVKSAVTEIAIPPDNSLQKVYYEKISPLPTNIRVDADGNWLAAFELKSRERVDIEVKGTVQIFVAPRRFPETPPETLAANLRETEFWQTTDPRIISLASQLKTPRAIYDYVAKNLKYDYTRVKPNVERSGAIKALANRKAAICMEFTDLFIALARAAGIPAREANGYAYTENPEIQPLSLVNDVLHAWPEYWDSLRKNWIPVDPTWAATTGGVNFFDKLDLRHFTFVIHGLDPTKPYPPGSYKLGSNPQKDVFVSFGKLPEKRAPEINLTYNLEKFRPFLAQKLNLEIKNQGNETALDALATIYFDSHLAREELLGMIPPYASRKIKLTIPFSFLGRQTPKTVQVRVGNTSVTIPTAKNEVIIYNLALVFLILVLVMLVILIKLGKIKSVYFKLR